MAAGATPATPGPPPSASQGSHTHKISDVITAFRPSRLFRAEGKTSVTSLDFDNTGELAIVTRDDDTLQIYNCIGGKHAKELKSQKYGVNLARFSHSADSIIYASTKVDDGIRYLSTHDNSFIRYFRGHKDTVSCLTMSPSNDTFLSCSLDNTVKLWNLNSSSPQGELKLHAPYLAAYDPSATVIAIASPPTRSVLLYDLRNYDRPPFATWDLVEYQQRYMPGSNGRDWTKIEFSNEGKTVLVGTSGSGHFVLDAFTGELKHFCLRPSQASVSRNAPGTAAPGAVAGQADVCISPDGQFLIGGSSSEGLLMWDIHKDTTPDGILRPSAELPGQDKAAVVGYNHKTNLILSADRNLMIWLPDPDMMP